MNGTSRVAQGCGGRRILGGHLGPADCSPHSEGRYSPSRSSGWNHSGLDLEHGTIDGRIGTNNCRNFVVEHGHTRLAALEKYEGLRLGQWVAQQRYRRTGTLDPDQNPAHGGLPRLDLGCGGVPGGEVSYIWRITSACTACPCSTKFRDQRRLQAGAVGHHRAVRLSRRPTECGPPGRLESLPGWSLRAPVNHGGTSVSGGLRITRGHLGTTRMVRDYIEPDDGFRLGMWAQHQRSLSHGADCHTGVSRVWKLSPAGCGTRTPRRGRTITADSPSTQRYTGQLRRPGSYRPDGYRLTEVGHGAANPLQQRHVAL